MESNFLARVGFEDAKIEHIPKDASTRTRIRASKNGKSVILTKYSSTLADRESLMSFIGISDYLLKSGLSAPKVLEYDVDSGMVLEEDFGTDNVFLHLLKKNPKIEEKLYSKATEALLHLHIIPVKSDLKRYVAVQALDRLLVFVDWGLHFYQAHGLYLVDDFWHACQKVIQCVNFDLCFMALWDYHSPNLMWLPDRPGVKAVGIIDFQDATLGPRAYDFVSLAQDARYFVHAGLYDILLNLYTSNMGDVSLECKRTFAEEARILGSIRALRIIGLFVRKCNQEHDPKYIQYIHILERYLRENLRSPIMQPLRLFFEKSGILSFTT